MCFYIRSLFQQDYTHLLLTVISSKPQNLLVLVLLLLVALVRKLQFLLFGFFATRHFLYTLRAETFAGIKSLLILTYNSVSL